MREELTYIVKYQMLSFIAMLFFITGVSALPITNALKLKISNTAYSDETVIRYLAGATSNFDGSYDAWKLFSSNPAVPQIYTMLPPSSPLSINTYSALLKDQQVNVYATLGSVGSYTITATEIGNFSSDINIFIENTATGDFQNLRTNPVYTFYVSDIAVCNSNSQKFIIHFSIPPPVSSDFSFDANTSVGSYKTVHFLNLSQNATSYSWDFGDGSLPSTERDPSHTFLLAGNFSVKLVAQTAMYADTTVKMIHINLPTQLSKSPQKEKCKLFYRNNVLTIDFNNVIQHSVALSIITVEGREVARGKLFDVSKITVPVNEKESVIYIVKLQTDGTSVTEKVLIEASL